jgi:hypothetical protein
VLFCLISLTSASAPLCPTPPPVNMTQLGKSYWFIHPKAPVRRRRAAPQGKDPVVITGNKWCQWYWQREENKTRVPSTITVAKCDNCDPRDCEPMYMYHRFLVWAPTCDSTTGDKHRIWIKVRRPIAYVYKKLKI